MGDIDEVSALLGELKSGISYIQQEVAQTRNLQASMDGKIDGLTTDKVLHESRLTALHKRQDEMEPRLNWVEMIIKRFLWLGAGVVAFVSFLVNLVFPHITRFLP